MTAVDEAVNAASDLSSAAAVFVDSLEDVSAASADLARAESRYYAAIGQTDIHDMRTWPRELAAVALHGHVQALRPFVPLVVAESAEQAADALADWTPPQELTDAVLEEPTPRGWAARMDKSDRETCAALVASLDTEWSR